ncbi:outer membrane protein OmpK, partial [Escherichia coli]|uniref:outer membrane protein OmpK n=1 Tax=Escherichia coli TaxID=562 RepID=UPI0025ACB2D1
MKKTLLAAGAVLALSSSFTVNAAENDKPQYLSDWWHQSVNVVGSYHTRFGPQIRNDTYLEYEAFAKKDWFDFYGYADAPVFFGGNSDAKGIWNHGSPLFMEIEPRFSIDKCVFRSIRSRIGIEVRSAIRIHSINRELNFFYRFLTRFFAAFH